jgi:hypothetical protein
MITTIHDYIKLTEAKTSEKGMDLIIVDVQEDYIKYFGEEYIEELNKYSEKFSRVFQIWDSKDINKPTYTFPNQVGAYSKEFGGKLDINLVDQLFHPSEIEYVKNKLINIPDENDYFETIYNEYWIYIGAHLNESFKGHEWFFCNKELTKLFKQLKASGRKCMLVGGAGGECILDIYKALRIFDIEVEYNNEFVYNKNGSEFQQTTNVK